MTVDTARAGADVYINSAVANTRWATTPDVRISTTKTLFTRIRQPAPRNTTIIENELVYTVRQAFPGSATLTLQRVAAAFSPGAITPANAPGVTGAVVSVLVSDLQVGEQIVFPITDLGQDISYGAPDNGYRIISDSATDLVLHSFEAGSGRPFLRTEWSRGPQQPTKIKPSYAAASVPRPKVSCDFVDRSGSTRISRMQVQIDPTYDEELNPVWGGADLYDTGEVVVDRPTVDLARNDLPGGIYAGLPSTRTPLRCRVRDGSGIWSPWSDPVDTWYEAQGTLEITAPGAAPNDTVAEYTPPIVWAYTPPDGAAQTHYQVLVARASNPRRYIYDSGKIASVASSHSLVASKMARKLEEDVEYRVWVRIWDDRSRESTEGQPVYIEANRTFTLEFDPTVDPVTALTAEQIGRSPWIELTWERATPPDSFTIIRDGRVLETDVLPGEVLVSGTSYRYRDWSAKPGVEHTYRVRPKVNNTLALAADEVTLATHLVVGIWIGDTEADQDVVLGGKDYDGSAADLAEVYQTFGAGEVVRQVMAVGGLAGSCTKLVLRSRDGRTWEDYRDVVNDIKSRPTTIYRLVLGDFNIPVAIGDVTMMPHASTRTEQVLKTVTFNWWQTGEHEFEALV